MKYRAQESAFSTFCPNLMWDYLGKYSCHFGVTYSSNALSNLIWGIMRPKAQNIYKKRQ